MGKSGPRPILLIGATGTIGTHLLPMLKRHQDSGQLQVRGTARSPASHGALTRAGFDAVPFNLDQSTTFAPAFAGVDTIFLLRPYTLRYLMQTKLVVDIAVQCGVRHIVTLSAYAREDSPWPLMGWQMIMDRYTAVSGLGWTHLRPNFIMDNLLVQRDRATATLINGLEPTISWVSSHDIARVAAAILCAPQNHAEKIYPLAAEAASLATIAGYFSTATGRRYSYRAPLRAQMMERLLLQGREPIYAETLIEYFEAINRIEVPEIADIFDTIERVTGQPHQSWPAFLEANQHRL